MSITYLHIQNLLELCTEGLLANILKWIDFPVLISTIFGGIIIWLLSESSKRGKLKIFITEQETRGICRTEGGVENVTLDLSDESIKYFVCWLAVDVYNPASYVKIARNIKFEATYANGEKVTLPAFRGENKITALNFEPKELQLIHFSARLAKDSIGQIKKLYLTFANESEKIKKIRVPATF